MRSVDNKEEYRNKGAWYSKRVEGFNTWILITSEGGSSWFIFYFRLWNNASAGQPKSFCLQYLQVSFPRIKPLPVVVKSKSNNTTDNKITLNFRNKKIIPITNGINDIKISGIKSCHFMSLLQNLAVSPFLKINELNLPFPNPQVLPQ